MYDGKIKSWSNNSGNLSLDKKIIEETLRDLQLVKCPICGRELEYKDNFGVTLSNNFNKYWDEMERYCPKENLIIQFIAQREVGMSPKTILRMKIFTNSRYSKLLAESGPMDIPGLVSLKSDN